MRAAGIDNAPDEPSLQNGKKKPRGADYGLIPKTNTPAGIKPIGMSRLQIIQDQEQAQDHDRRV